MIYAISIWELGSAADSSLDGASVEVKGCRGASLA